MGRANNSKKKKKNGRRRPNKPSTVKPNDQWNFLPEAGPGCHIARKDDLNNASAWILEWEDVDPAEFVGEDVPDLAVDTEEHTLTLCNIEDVWKVAYISIYDCIIRGRNGQILTVGSTTKNTCTQQQTDTQQQQQCTTLIVLCPPHQFAHLCYLPDTISPSTLKLESDVQEWQRHPNPADTHATTIGFPLLPSSSNSPSSFLCTQGVGGYLTHFFAGNLHAIDFRCPVGTPLLAVGTGTVVSVKVDTTVTGIGVTNLFQWNSILIQLEDDNRDDSTKHRLLSKKDLLQHSPNINEDTDANDENINETIITAGPLFVEYVHIQSATVKAGDRVKRGQVIGESGSVGFSPEPHLHLACYRTPDDTAPTCRVYFSTSNGSSVFLPKAGHWYNSDGLADNAPSSATIATGG